MGAAKKDDPLAKLGDLIDTKIKEAFESRDQHEREEKDPWARVEGMIDRAVGKHFEALKAENPPKSEKSEPDKKKGGGGFLELLTGTDAE